MKKQTKPFESNQLAPSFFKKHGKYLLLLLIPLIGFGINKAINNPNEDFISNPPETREASLLDDIKDVKADALKAEAGIKNSQQKLDAIEKDRQAQTPINTNANSGTFKDARDGQTYKWVRLKDDKKWMAENLNYKTADSWWYDNDSSNGDKYGRLYTLQAANSACPSGWRIPTDDEWWKMTSYYGYSHSGSRNNVGQDAGKAAYVALLQGGSSGFSGMLGGTRSDFEGESYSFFEKYGGYWSSTETTKSNSVWTYAFVNFTDTQTLERSYDYKSAELFCRCLQD